MEKVLDFLNGKKTYIVAVVIAVTAGVQALGYTVPEWVYALETALGLGAVRVGVAKSGPTEPTA